MRVPRTFHDDIINLHSIGDPGEKKRIKSNEILYRPVQARAWSDHCCQISVKRKFTIPRFRRINNIYIGQNVYEYMLYALVLHNLHQRRLTLLNRPRQRTCISYFALYLYIRLVRSPQSIPQHHMPHVCAPVSTCTVPNTFLHIYVYILRLIGRSIVCILFSTAHGAALENVIAS